MKDKQEKLKEKKKTAKEKYVCPDCGYKHSEEHHPPYCQSCIFAITL